MTLKKRLLLTLLLVGLLPVIAISFFNAEIARQSLTEQALQQLSIAATNKQHSVEDYLSTIARQLKAMANNRGTRTAAQGFGLAFQNYEKLVKAEQSTLRDNVEAYYQQNFCHPCSKMVVLTDVQPRPRSPAKQPGSADGLHRGQPESCGAERRIGIG